MTHWDVFVLAAAMVAGVLWLVELVCEGGEMVEPLPRPISFEEFKRCWAAGARTFNEIQPEFVAWEARHKVWVEREEAKQNLMMCLSFGLMVLVLVGLVVWKIVQRSAGL